MCLVLEVADDLIGGKDGADFDFTVDLLVGLRSGIWVIKVKLSYVFNNRLRN